MSALRFHFPGESTSDFGAVLDFLSVHEVGMVHTAEFFM